MNSTTASGVVLDNLGGTSASTNWYEGDWSDRRGWPSAVGLYEGRLAWAGKSKIWLSVSDAYESFDDTVIGDSGPINRSIGSGPIDNINWLFTGNRLVMGTASAEASIRSSSFDEPLTPTAFSIKFPSTMGSANVPLVKVDSTGVFVQRGGVRIYRLVYDGNSYEYAVSNMTALVPEIGLPSFTRLAVQRQPDTRIHGVRSDGTVAMMIDDPVEEVSCWIEDEMGGDGIVEDAFIMPGSIEDRVYYLVKRTINGNTVRYLEKGALESECQGGTLNKQLDSFVSISQASSTTITGLSHLEGATVRVWGNGKYLGSYVVSGGQITGVTEAVTAAIVGLTYRARFKSAKLSASQETATRAATTALAQKKRLESLGLLLYNVHKEGLTFGTDFDHMDPISVIIEGAEVADDTVTEFFDVEMMEVNDLFSLDSRLCLEANAPFPVTVLAAVLGISSEQKL